MEIKRNINVKELCDKIVNGNVNALSRAITLIESNNFSDRAIANKILLNFKKSVNNSIRIGITGVPGVGKSTFIEALGNNLTKIGKKIAILTIDPSSSISKGSILGDKTRMTSLSRSKNAFIRPTATSNFQGGVARNTKETIFLCENAGYEIIIIETVGVGQNEISVSEMVDFFLLLKISGAGDQLQGIKRGIIEMSDLIAINKSDGENINNALISKNEFEMALKLFPRKKSNWTPKVLTCSSINNNGIDEIWNTIKNYVKITKKNNFFYRNRIEQNKKWLIQIIDSSLRKSFYEKIKVKNKLERLIKKIESNKISIFEASQNILSEI